MKHILLYIPGLGDSYDHFRQKALRTWPVFGIEVQLVPMTWYDGVSYDEKYQRASRLIKSLTSKGVRVSLVGESAGGSMALNLFATHPEVASLVTIAGVNRSSAPVAERTLRRGPAFATSRQQVSASLAAIPASRRHAIWTISGLVDSAVRAPDSHIPGAHNRHIWTIGHFVTITLCLTVLSGYVIFLAKKITSV
jgi:pimeloyl-ACP methyl ester carboxylesterase